MQPGIQERVRRSYPIVANSEVIPILSSHYVVTGPLRWPWVRLSLFEEHSPEPQAEGAGHEREVTIFGFGCPC